MAPGTLPPGFNGLQYIASYPDLIQSLGADRAAGERHYLRTGQGEGRAADTFDLLRYLDNNPDVAAAFGARGDGATIHYIQQGFFEGRNDDPPPGLPAEFNGLQYIASYPDLIQTIGADRFAGEKHYLDSARLKAGRRIRLISLATWTIIPTSPPRSAPTAPPRPSTTSSRVSSRVARMIHLRACRPASTGCSTSPPIPT